MLDDCGSNCQDRLVALLSLAVPEAAQCDRRPALRTTDERFRRRPAAHP